METVFKSDDAVASSHQTQMYSLNTVVENDDFYAALFKYMEDQQIPELETIKIAFDTVQKRAQISIRDHLNFGQSVQPSHLHTTISTWGKFIGEQINLDAKYCRGINIYSDGRISIGYYLKSSPAPGNYIWINGDGRFKVGKYYGSIETLGYKGTEYKTDGTTQEY